ncbi:hypothetical protein GF389_00965 [Candidatus Dojkabacteria bacterium]|nr:hypothetical protein [Candidatus Dojkabacteria bacterium]
MKYRNFSKILSDFFKDKNGKIVIGQRPNAPLILWMLFFLLANLPMLSELREALSLVSNGFLLFWAILEITMGVNVFRRALGGLVLVVVLIFQL